MFRPLRTALLSCIICLGFIAHAAAGDLPAPPPDGLRDDTRALSEKARAELVSEMAACRTAIGADVWFSAGTFLGPGQTIALQARTLRQAWSPGKDAVLLAYDRASDAHTLSLSPGLWNRYPSAEIIALMQRSIAAMADKSQPLEARLSQALRTTLLKLQTLEKQRLQSTVTLSRHHLRLAQTFAIALGAGAVLLALASSRVRRRDVQAAWQSFFPQVEVGTRYGALHGGGVIVERVPQDGGLV